MKCRILWIGLFLMTLHQTVKSQGLEGIVVEKYYQANSADAQYTVNQGYTYPLLQGSVTYRIYVDMAQGYKFVQMFGTPSQNLNFTTSTFFYNDENYDSQTGPTTSVINTKKHTAMIDSWITTGGAANGKVGVTKDEDTDGTIANGATGNTNGILFNSLGGCFGSMITGATGKDGMLASAALTVVSPNVLGMGGATLDALTAGNSVGVINVSNGAIAALGGIVGATSSNRVLVGQFTTDGTFTFALNVQLLSPTGVAENYVHSNLSSGQFTHPTLIRTASAPSVSIVSDAAGNQTCNGSAVNFTATALNAGIPTYQWKVNGVNVGTNSSSFSSSALTNGSIVTCVVTPDCGATTNTLVTSNAITMGINNPTNYYLDNDGDGFGAGSALSACTNPGAGYVSNNTDCNDNNAAINTSATEICNTIDDDCDNQIDEGLSVTPSVTIVSNDSDNSICSGTNVTFTASPSDGGSAPSYQWKVNGVNAGTNSTSFSTSTLTNNAVVTVVMTANNTCQTSSTATSDGITTLVNSNVTPSVSIASNDADNSICSGASVTFTASPTNGGAAPAYQWKVNGVNTGTNAATYSTATLSNNAVVTVVMTANNTCQTESTANGNTISIAVLNNQSYFMDADSDGFGSGAAISSCTSPGPNYVLLDGDCEDNSALISPSQSEICNETDDNCNGEVDEFVLITYYADLDGDGFGDLNNTAYACAAPSGYVLDSQDCSDAIVTFEDNDGDGFGSNVTSSCGVENGGTDCDDNNAAIFAGATEVCNLLDDNCNQEIDEFVQNTYYADLDLDGFGDLGNVAFACELPTGYTANSDDCDDNQITFEDLDNDGFGSGNLSSCGVTNHDDCLDSDATINPSATEICDNGSDENCEPSDDACLIFGCTDVNAFNYNPFANVEDGSCVAVVLGCTDNTALNYNSAANTNDGSCIPFIYGCTDLTAFNYNPQANTDDGSCVPVIYGCTSVNALNYSPSANTDDGSCIPFVFGCIDPSACNYNVLANYNDGSCIYAQQEICNELDDDCDGEIDEFVQSSFYADLDQDGFGDLNNVVFACQIPSGYVNDNSDCDDSTLTFVDNDGDGFGGSVLTSCGVLLDGDCNDADATASPISIEVCGNSIDEDCNGILEQCDVFGCTDPTACNYDTTATVDDMSCILPSSEICNLIDDNCNGEIDEFVQVTFYADLDQDGYGDLNNVIFACEVPIGYVNDNSDCDDSALTFADADGDGFGSLEFSACGVLLDGDCDDLDANTSPLSIDICGNSIDEDCNGLVEQCDILGCTDPTACNYDSTANVDDFSCVLPTTEICNSLDDNCNGEIDEFVQITYYADLDGDGFGDINNVVFECSVPNGYVENSFDCDDNAILYMDTDGDGYGSSAIDACGVVNTGDCLDFDDTVNPGATEICDGFDQNCDGVADENLLSIYYADQDNDGFGDANNFVSSCSQDPGYVTDNSDCDDSQLLYVDADQDGYGTIVPAACGATNTTDCDDANAAVNPGAQEVPNNAIDEDCDGEAVSVQSVGVAQLTVYPVPAMDEFVIGGLALYKNKNITVLDVQGRKLLTRLITQDMERFDCTDWSNGMYTIHIDGQSGSIKMVVSH